MRRTNHIPRQRTELRTVPGGGRESIGVFDVHVYGLIRVEFTNTYLLSGP
jgi:hypothetical protein